MPIFGIARSVSQHRGVEVAADGIGVLPQLAVLQIERPDVVDLAVARHVRIDRLRGIGGGRREDQRVGIQELRRGIVVRPERQLCLLAGGHVDAEQLLVAADACDVDDGPAIRRPGGRGIGERVLGDVGDLLRLQVANEDVSRPVLKRGEGDLPSVRREVGGLGVVHQASIEALLDLAGQDVLNDQRSGLLRAREIRQAISGARPREPRHRDPAATRCDDELEAEALIEALGEVAHDAAVVSGDEQDVALAIARVAREDGQQIARRETVQRCRRPGTASSPGWA